MLDPGDLADMVDMVGHIGERAGLGAGLAASHLNRSADLGSGFGIAEMFGHAKPRDSRPRGATFQRRKSSLMKPGSATTMITPPLSGKRA
jgi:hypothetical protein